MRRWLRNLFHQQKPLSPAEIEQLRVDFRERYHHFKLLLGANNRALEIMADMENLQQLHGLIADIQQLIMRSPLPNAA